MRHDPLVIVMAHTLDLIKAPYNLHVVWGHNTAPIDLYGPYCGFHMNGNGCQITVAMVLGENILKYGAIGRYHMMTHGVFCALIDCLGQYNFRKLLPLFFNSYNVENLSKNYIFVSCSFKLFDRVWHKSSQLL